MTINRKLDYVILDMVESATRTIRTAPLNLGALPGNGGGNGAPPGGYIGWLPQTRVAYDTDEFATLDTPASGQSLLDNLNHIRYRLNTLESGGSITIVDDNLDITYLDTTHLHFSGAGVQVVELSSGHVQVIVEATGSGGGGTPLVVEDVGGSPSITNVDKIVFSGLSVQDLGSGDVLVSHSGGGGVLIVEDADGVPSISNVDKIIFSGAVLTDLGNGDVLVEVSGGTGSSSNLYSVQEVFYPTTASITHYDSLHIIESGSLKLYYNGVRQRPVDHFLEDSDGGGFTVLFSPISNETLVADYTTASGIEPTPVPGLTVVNNTGFQMFASRNLRGQNNTTTPNSKMDFSADMVILWNPSDYTTELQVSTGTITNDTGVSGPTANGRDQSGAFSNSSWVHFYFIWNGDTLATISSASAPMTGPTLPSGYTHWAYIGPVRKNGSGNFLKVLIAGDRFFLIDSENSVLSGGTATTFTAVSMTAAVPPNCTEYDIQSRIEYFNTSAGSINLVEFVIDDATPTGFGKSFVVVTPVSNQWHGYTVTTSVPNLSQSFEYRWNVNAGTRDLDIYCVSYKIPNWAS